MKQSLRNDYLSAMQITRWVPRVTLPYAAQSPVNEALATIVEPRSAIASTPLNAPASQPPLATITNKDTISAAQVTNNVVETSTEIPHFSLQLMQAGNCLLLIELTQHKALQIDDATYQLLRNILKAAKLPDSPKLLGEVIHWPLFKQVNIPQGIKQAQEFMQSYITTFQEQLVDTKCLWLIGLTAIQVVTGLTAQHLYQAPILQSLGQTLLAPSLNSLLEQPQQKAALWQSIKQLIPLWQA